MFKKKKKAAALIITFIVCVAIAIAAATAVLIVSRYQLGLKDSLEELRQTVISCITLGGLW